MNVTQNWINGRTYYHHQVFYAQLTFSLLLSNGNIKYLIAVFILTS